MARYRIYPSKNSVIFEDDTDRNVGLNEVFELWYGTSGATRAVVKWDFESYVNLVEGGTAPALTASTLDSMKAVFTCTYPILGSGSSVGDASYTLSFANDSSIVDFEEGVGWWHTGDDIVTGFTNWLSANTTTEWEAAGATGDSIDTITVARDAAEMEFSFDASDLSAAWTTVSTADTALTTLRFSDAYEALTGNPGQRRLFYSRHTNTDFLPYIELNWDDQVKEDRANVIEGVTSSLYLFVYNRGVLDDPESVDSVTILGTEHTGITKVSTGIYKYDYVLPANSGGTGTVISDVWNITFTGSLTGSITQQFTGVSIDNSALWSGDTALKAQKYQVSLPNLEEEYSTGDTIYVRVKFRQEFTRAYTVLKDAEYRVHIPNPVTGEPLLMMYDWSPISYRDENFFIMHLSWFLVGKTYQVDVRYSDGHSTVIDSKPRKFTVTS